MSKVIRPDGVAIYIRWSTDDQASGTTLAVQREGCEHYVRSQGWTVTEHLIFVDDGYSGSNLSRPGITKLRKLVDDGVVDCVVVLKIDRLSRNIVDAVELVLRAWADRCHVKSVREPIDTTSDLGRMIFGILAMFADFERAQIRDRTLGGKVKRIAEGKQLHGRPAYGYQSHPSERGKWVAEPAEAPLVRSIFQMAASGVSANQISRHLNAAGTRTRSGRLWSIRSILTILHNRVYIGEVEFGKTSLKLVPGRGTVRVRNAQPRVSGPTQAAPPLVDAELHRAAHIWLERNRTARRTSGSRGASSPHLLVGLAECPCGGALVHKGVSRKGVLTRHYVCHRSRNGSCRQNGHIPAEVVEETIEEAFIVRYGLGVPTADEVRLAYPTIRDEQQGVEEAIATVRNDLDRQRHTDRRLVVEWESGSRSLEEISWARDEVQHRGEDLASRLVDLNRQRDTLATAAERLLCSLQQAEGASPWALLAAHEKRQLIKLGLNARIRIHKPRGSSLITVEIPWTVTDTSTSG